MSDLEEDNADIESVFSSNCLRFLPADAGDAEDIELSKQVGLH